MTGTVYTNFVGTQNRRQYAMTADEVNAALGSLGYVSGTVSLSNYVLTSTLVATLATYAALAGTNVFTGKQEFKELPWADITAYGAVGNNSTDCTAAIQAAIDYMNTNYLGGIIFVPPGNYHVGAAGVTLKSGCILLGSGQNDSYINGGGQDATVITFDDTTSYGALRDLLIGGYQSTLATKNCVVVSNGVVANMTNVRVVGGKYALFNGGADGRLYNVFANGFNGGCVYSTGANWYSNCKFDSSGAVNDSAGFYQSAFFTVGTAENSLLACDLSGNFTNSLVVDDGTTQQVQTKVIGCVLSSSAVVKSHKWTLFMGCEIGANFTLTGTNPVTIVGCYAGSTVTGAGGANVVTSANFNI